MPNSFAYLMLAIWPLITITLFRRMPVQQAIVWSILGAYLILPPVANFDLPLVPNMDKRSISNLALLAVLVLLLRKPVPLLPLNGLARVFAFGYVFAAVPTVLTNGEPVVFQLLGSTEPIVFAVAELPGMGLRDMLSLLVEQFLLLIPFLVARAYLSDESGMRALLVALVVGGVLYALPAAFETRFSPQLNIWIYGFFQHDFQQMIRGSGYRPIVFLQHGLWAAFLFMTAAVAAMALARQELGRARLKYLAAAGLLLIIVYLAKSLGSQIYTLIFVPLVLLAGPKLQIRISVLLVAIALTYPVLRQNGWVPLDRFVENAAEVSEARADSLAYRFENEEVLLERAQEKPLFGWGSWGRNLVRDRESGEILSIPDGEWIIQFGVFGWFGYICTMGLLAWPVVLLNARAGLWARRPEARLVSAVGLLLAITMLDLLVNAILTPYTWLMTGALLGYAERLKARTADDGRAQARRRTVLANDPLPEHRTRL